MSDEQVGRPKRGGRRESDKPKCGAKLSRRPGETCSRYPLKNQKRCKLHGGGTKAALAAAAKRGTEEKLLKVLGSVEATPVRDPLTVLSELAGEILAWKDLLATRIGALQSYGYAGEHGEQIRHEVQLYEKALDRSLVALDKIARLDIDSRLAAIGERQAALLESAVDAALAPLKLSPQDSQRAWTSVAEYLTTVPRVA